MLSTPTVTSIGPGVSDRLRAVITREVVTHAWVTDAPGTKSARFLNFKRITKCAHRGPLTDPATR